MTSRGRPLARRRSVAGVRVLRVARLLVAGAALTVFSGCNGVAGERTVTIMQPGDGAAGEQDAPRTEVRPGDCANAETQPGDGNLREIEQATRCLVDAERVKRDRSALAADDRLAEAARAKAGDMVDKQYFAHVGPDERDVRDWVAPTGYLEGSGAAGLGENLGWASAGGATPLRIVEGWMNSASHRRNILRPEWEDTGLGVVRGAPREEGGGGATYVQLFGRRGG
ncbi:MAG: CAP domain-containing protein [Thermoleophilia bacterium]